MDLRKDTKEQSQSNWVIWHRICLFQTWERQVANEKMTCQQVIQDLGAKKLSVEISSSHSLREVFCCIFRKSGNPTSPRNSIHNTDFCVVISLGTIFLLSPWGMGRHQKKPCTVSFREQCRGFSLKEAGLQKIAGILRTWSERGWTEEAAPLKYQNVFFYRPMD